MNDASLNTIFSTAGYGNTYLVSAGVDVLKLIQPFNYANPDFTPFMNSSGTSANTLPTSIGTLGIYGHIDFKVNGSFTDSQLQDPFFEKVTFRGAVAGSGVNQTWWKGWTVWK